MSNVNEPLEIGKADIDYSNADEVFLVGDLFKGYVGNRISRSDRHLVGTLSLNFIRNKNNGVIIIEKTSMAEQE